MKRQINYIRHLSVFVLTIIIFVLGVFIGGSLEDTRINNLYTQLQEQDLLLQNIIAESNYIDYLLSTNSDSATCDTIIGAYYTSIANLDDSRLKLENYMNTAQVRQEEYLRLRAHYSNVQVNYWVLANRISNLCAQDLNTILYFFSEDRRVCPSCQDQGIHLGYVKQVLRDDVLIFSLDVDNNLGPSHLLKQNFDVNSRELPVLVINDEVYGFLRNQQIFDILNESQQ